MRSLMKMLPAVLVVMMSIAGAACTPTSPKPVVVPQNGAISPADGGGAGDGVGGGGQVLDPAASTGGEFRTELTRQVIESLGLKDMAALSYRLTFLDQTRTGQLTMSGQSGSETGSIVEKNLPAGRTGSLVLELMENGVVKARGQKDGVTLVVGQANRVNLTMSRVGTTPPNTPPGSNSTSDLSIDIAIDMGPTTTPNNPQPPINPTNPTVPDLGQLVNWDGRSHLGNDRWTIETVR